MEASAAEIVPAEILIQPPKPSNSGIHRQPTRIQRRLAHLSRRRSPVRILLAVFANRP